MAQGILEHAFLFVRTVLHHQGDVPRHPFLHQLLVELITPQ
jgi:hypothetical protein